ncbi:MAG: UTP--glucose-1-phosphate uridylyltransferase [Myxococcota bacterium]
MSVKGVIVAAGYGSRLLPITRVVPKELLPLVDRPAIDFIVQEFVEAGIEELLVITSRRKRALEDWFDRDPELDEVFAREGATDKLRRSQPPKIRAYTVRQTTMGGTGDALRLVRAFAGTDPVVVAYPDDLFVGCNVTSQLIEAHAQTGCCALIAEDLGDVDVSRYGVLDAVTEGELLRVRRIVEKPPAGTEPSKMVTYGRYLYTPEFFPVLDAHFERHTSGEFYPMGAIEQMAGDGKVVAALLQGSRRDTGTALGYMKATIDEALARPDLGPALRAWLSERLQS